jgi:hypothetical protein
VARVRPALAGLPLAGLILLGGTAVAGCDQAEQAVRDNVPGAALVQDCGGVILDAARAGLRRTPSVEEAQSAADRLADRAAGIQDTTLREAAQALADRLREVRDSVARADSADVQRAVGSARDAARRVAERCNVPVDQVLGG